MTSILLGLLGAALGVGFFVAGFALGRRSAAAPAPVEKTPSEIEQEELEREREKLKADQAAFHEMMGYSADIAYGLKKRPGRE